MSASGSRSKPKRAETSSTVRRARSRSMMPAGPVGSKPSAMDSATVKTGISMKCWCTMPMPAATASSGPLKVTGSPSMRICPSSGASMPYRTFISVDLPAPFSPSRAWMCPSSIVTSIESLAMRGPNLFVIPRSSSFIPWAFPVRLGGTPLPGWGRRAQPPAPPSQHHFGAFCDSITSLPVLMSSVSLARSALSSSETFASKSWKGASETPPLASVPT